MRKLFIFVILAWLLLPLPWLSGQGGAFNVITNMYWCKNTVLCRHELGHYIDKSNGWISHTQKFQFAIQVYLVSSIQLNNFDNTATIISGMIGQPIEEIYATIYSQPESDIPPSLKQFYPPVNSRFIKLKMPVGDLFIECPTLLQ